MLPSITEAESLLKDAEACNPGPWGNHSKVAAHCAKEIALRCEGMDADKAYILGLLHDIGRKYGTRHLGHVADGYSYMMKLGYDEAAKICLTHSFNNHTLDEYIGKNDVTPEEYSMIQEALQKTDFDDYDLLIQLCDSISGSNGVLDIEERMADVRSRYGAYPKEKWNRNLFLKQYFEEKMGQDIYSAVDREHFRP